MAWRETFRHRYGRIHKEEIKPGLHLRFSDALIEMAKEDETIIGITAAMPDGTGISDFGKVFPERTFDVGMAEQHAVSLQARLRLKGSDPSPLSIPRSCNARTIRSCMISA